MYPLSFFSFIFRQKIFFVLSHLFLSVFFNILFSSPNIFCMSFLVSFCISVFFIKISFPLSFSFSFSDWLYIYLYCTCLFSTPALSFLLFLFLADFLIIFWSTPSFFLVLHAFLSAPLFVNKLSFLFQTWWQKWSVMKII